jgi:hypothetical protein
MKISERLQNLYKELYPGGGRINSVFDGGNAGNALLAESLEVASENIKAGMYRLAEAIEKLQPEKEGLPETQDVQLFTPPVSTFNTPLSTPKK